MRDVARLIEARDRYPGWHYTSLIDGRHAWFLDRDHRGRLVIVQEQDGRFSVIYHDLIFTRSHHFAGPFKDFAAAAVMYKINYRNPEFQR